MTQDTRTGRADPPGTTGSTRAFDPELAAALALMPALAIEDVAAARIEAEAFFAASRDAGIDGLEELEIIERTVPGTPDVPVRIYTPTEFGSDLPCALYIHGGGFIFGRLDLDHALAATLAPHTGAVVATPDHRVAP